MSSGRGAALPELLKIIETLSLNIGSVTISELADLIERDAVVLARIIAVANTLAHNPGIAPLTTLSQAIHQLGYNRIRTIAVSLMLIDTAGPANPHEQREAAAQALCAGLIAQSTAECLGTHDPEFAFACAALRNFGRIIFAAVSGEHYREAIKLAPSLGEPAAYRAQFGVTLIQFTHQLLSSAKLPGEVLQSLRECEPESLAGVASTYDARLLGIVDFGSRLASLTLDARHGPDAYVGQLRALARRFDRLVPGAPEIAKPALQRTGERLRNFNRCNGLRPMPTASLDRLHVRLRELSPSAIPPETAADHLSVVDAGISTAPFDTSESDDVPLALDCDPLPADAGVFDSLPVDAPPTDPLHDALTLVSREFAAQECWLFRGTPRESSFSFIQGLGRAVTQLPASARLTADERSVFGVCLRREEVVLIHDTADVSILPYLPDWFRKNTGAPPAFSLIPLRDRDALTGLLLVGWDTPRHIVISPLQIALVRQILTTTPAPLPVSNN